MAGKWHLLKSRVGGEGVAQPVRRDTGATARRGAPRVPQAPPHVGRREALSDFDRNHHPLSVAGAQRRARALDVAGDRGQRARRRVAFPSTRLFGVEVERFDVDETSSSERPRRRPARTAPGHAAPAAWSPGCGRAGARPLRLNLRQSLGLLRRGRRSAGFLLDRAVLAQRAERAQRRELSRHGARRGAALRQRGRVAAQRPRRDGRGLELALPDSPRARTGRRRCRRRQPRRRRAAAGRRRSLGIVRRRLD